VLLDSPLDCSSCVLPMESDNPYHFVLTHEGKHLAFSLHVDYRHSKLAM
jgi:hypothetical protein